MKMNTIILEVLKILLNALVVGVVVYFIQKKIESSFTKKMEQFRANLQLSNFEQQTKFARSLERRAETLETLCQKYKVFSETTEKRLDEVFRFYIFHSQETGNVFDEIDFEIPFQELEDFWKDFGNNRHFLSDDIIEGIENIYHNSYQILLIAIVAIQSDNTQTQEHKDFKTVNEMIQSSRLKINRIVSKTLNIELFLKDVKEEANNQVLEIESLYKSVVNTKSA